MKRKRFNIIAGILAVLFILSAYIALKKVDHSLVHRSVCLNNLQGADIVWISPTEVVTVSGDADPGDDRSVERANGTQPPMGKRMQVNGKAVSQLSGFNSFAAGTAHINFHNWRISPDGKKLAFQCSVTANSWGEQSRIAIYDLAKPESEPVLITDSLKDRNTTHSILSWLPDSERIAVLRDETEPAIELVSCKMPWTEPTRVGFASGAIHSSVCTADNRLITLEQLPQTTEALQLKSTPVYPCIGAPGIRKIPVPAVGTLISAEISPDAQHILWCITSVSQSRFYALLHRISARWAARFAPRLVISVYITDDRGGSKEYLGSENAGDLKNRRSISEISWLPDSKSISYSNDNKTYLMKAPF
jgi:WD40-like Beta Propeller Repeat